MSFAIAPKVVHFKGRTTLQQFQKHLEHDWASLQVLSLKEVADAAVFPNGKLQGTHTFTWPALYQYLHVAKGIYVYLRELDITPVDNLAPGIPFNKYCARQINQITNMHWAGLVKSRFILNEAHKTVDGHVGRSFVVVSNAKVFEGAIETCENLSGRPEFRSATLIGRDMTADFMAKTPISGSSGIAMYRGILVQNRETSGRAIRLTNLVFDTFTKSWSADNFYSDTRIPHLAVNKLRDKMALMSDSIQRRRLAEKVLVDTFNGARQPVKPASELGKKLRQTFNRSVAKFAIPSYVIASVLSPFTNKAPSKLDLYTSLLKAADTAPPGLSLSLRQTAYFFMFKA